LSLSLTTKQARAGLTFDQLARSSGALRGTIEREWLAWALRDEQQRRALWVELPDSLAVAIEATIGPREDRDPDAALFPRATADRLRTAIARACRAAAMPTFSPHDLRHRRISLLHRQGRSWAEIGRFVDQRKLSVTADTYTHVMPDSREADYAEPLVA
jgi:integrase